MFVNELTEKEHNELIKLVQDLAWDWDRLSSSGQEPMEKIIVAQPFPPLQKKKEWSSQ